MSAENLKQKLTNLIKDTGLKFDYNEYEIVPKKEFLHDVTPEDVKKNLKRKQADLYVNIDIKIPKASGQPERAVYNEIWRSDINEAKFNEQWELFGRFVLRTLKRIKDEYERE